jgi:hypothetical protein
LIPPFLNINLPPALSLKRFFADLLVFCFGITE